MFRLKTYQQRALDALNLFLQEARLGKATAAFASVRRSLGINDPLPYRHYSFGETPYVCLRLPTGGGKTVLASHTIRVATRSYLEQEFPMVLWLVPTKTIRQQTLEALKQSGHPYRFELDRAFDHQVRILDIDEVNQIRPQDIGSKTIVVVSTMASLRVTETNKRNVYAYHEDFEPHFAKVDKNDSRLERVSEADIQENGLSVSDVGKVKYSFTNLLALNNPLVIVDEAHNARTSLTFETLQRVHPAAIIEFTATPDISATSASNVLFHVSASELKAEEMIKLPIMLTEHDHWQESVRDAVLTQKKLLTEARKESEYIRPIVLFQAEPKNGTVTVGVLKKFLLEDLQIREDAIAIATGSQRELDGINLFERSCPIEHIITIEALKEGWDCSFAYVFCSVKPVRSSKDAEQLLGRVLRMPYAKRREQEALNRAYAHLSSSSFSQAAQELTDKLISMGFEAVELAPNIQPGSSGQQDLFLPGDHDLDEYIAETPLTLELPGTEAILEVAEKLSDDVSIEEHGEGVKVEVRGFVNDDRSRSLAGLLKGKEKKYVAAVIEQHNLRLTSAKSPAARGTIFAPIPQLCLMIQDELELLEKGSYLNLFEWSLLDYPIELSQFQLKESATTFEVNIEDKKVAYQIAEERVVYNLNLVDSGVSENNLVRWLDRELRQPDISQSDLLAYLRKLVTHLT